MNFRRLFDIFPYQAARYPQQIALAQKLNNKWHHYSTEECIDLMQQLSTGFLDLGLQAGDKVGIMSALGSPPWNLIDLSLQQIGVVVVPVHASIKETELVFILQDAEVKFCFADGPELFNMLMAVQKKVPSFEKVLPLSEWKKLLKNPSQRQLTLIAERKTAIQEEDLATIIYTSGTTGQPKGVMLSHKNIVSNIKSTISLLPVTYKHRTISFLPMSHIFERMAIYTYFAVGTSVYYAENVERIVANIEEVRPHYFTAVPRLLERLYDSILEEATKKTGIQRRILRWALKLGESYQPNRKRALWYWLRLQIADLLVFRKWRQVLGGKVKGVIVGAAALQPKLGQLFSAAGIHIREGYGLTETSPAIAFNRFEPGGVRYGTVGIPVPGVELRIDSKEDQEEGEILVRGPNVMMGYYRNPEMTEKVIDKEGWFHTGDVGKIVHKRFLQITDRKKDIFKTSSGKYVAPQKVENLLKSSRFISQCMIVGFNRPYVTALLIPNFVHLERWCQNHNVHWTSPQYMVLNPKVEQFMQNIMDTLNEQLTKEARVRRIHLLHEEWSVSSGEYAQTLKLRRAFILDRYQKEIEALYAKKN